jgi:hypothetical protein
MPGRPEVREANRARADETAFVAGCASWPESRGTPGGVTRGPPHLAQGGDGGTRNLPARSGTRTYRIGRGAYRRFGADARGRQQAVAALNCDRIREVVGQRERVRGRAASTRRSWSGVRPASPLLPAIPPETHSMTTSVMPAVSASNNRSNCTLSPARPVARRTSGPRTWASLRWTPRRRSSMRGRLRRSPVPGSAAPSAGAPVSPSRVEGRPRLCSGPWAPMPPWHPSTRRSAGGGPRT